MTWGKKAEHCRGEGGRDIHFCVVITVDEPLSWRSEYEIIIGYHFAIQTNDLKVLTVKRSPKRIFKIMTLIN
jgi:hypothetical protein